MNKSILIGGLGNPLLNDDGFGPCVAQALQAGFSFSAGVEVADLGRPAPN